MASKITQTISYMTQVHTSWDGSEQRIALRAEPRQSISYDYIGVNGKQSQWLRALQHGKQAQKLQFPLWHVNCRLTDSAYKNQIAVTVPKEMLWGFRNISIVEFWLDDEKGGKAYKIKYITAAGVIGLVGKLEEDWPAGKTVVVPVFYGVLTQKNTYRNATSVIAEMSVSVDILLNQHAPPYPASLDFEHDEPESYDAHHNIYKLPTRYQGIEVLTYAPYWTDALGSKCSRNINKIDYGTGIYRYDVKSNLSLSSYNFGIAGIDRCAVYNFQRFFMRHLGMCKSFWMPTWTSDIELVQNAQVLTNILVTKFNQDFKYYNQNNRRKKIIIFFYNREPLILDVTGYAVGDKGNHGYVYLTNPLTENLLIPQIAQISFFIRARFGSDTLKIDYETTNIATHDIELVEVDPREGD